MSYLNMQIIINHKNKFAVICKESSSSEDSLQVYCHTKKDLSRKIDYDILIIKIITLFNSNLISNE